MWICVIFNRDRDNGLLGWGLRVGTNWVGVYNAEGWVNCFSKAVIFRLIQHQNEDKRAGICKNHLVYVILGACRAGKAMYYQVKKGRICRTVHTSPAGNIHSFLTAWVIF